MSEREGGRRTAAAGEQEFEQERVQVREQTAGAGVAAAVVSWGSGMSRGRSGSIRRVWGCRV